MAISHHAFPQPEDQGFDYTRSDRGATKARKDRLAEFATDAADDPYRLDEDGFPFHQNSEDALTFMRENKDKPFFHYYATCFLNLIDENNFLRSYPEIRLTGAKPSASALSVKDGAILPAPAKTGGSAKTSAKRSKSFAEKDADNDGKITQQEYVGHFVTGFERKDKNKDGGPNSR